MAAKEDVQGALREVVALFSDRAGFEGAVETLLNGGFQRTDLSVLSSHQSLDAAGSAGRAWDDVVTGLVGEIKYEGPLVTAGLIAIAAGPVGAAIAGIIAAGVGGAAIKELLDEVTARPHSEEFARALEAGSVILWVACDGDAAERNARALLAKAGGANIHAHNRA